MSKKRKLGWVLIGLLLIFGCSRPEAGSPPVVSRPIMGRVIDAASKKPIAGAIVTIDGKATLVTGADGAFAIGPEMNRIAARACGYTRTEQELRSVKATQLELNLTPIKTKGLYLTVYGIGSKSLRNAALNLIDTTELNTLVIDVKGDRGFIPYKSDIPLAHQIGARNLTLINDVKELVQSLKARGIYTIARIVVFKDNMLGSARPDLAVKTAAGAIWHDRENLIWVEPSKREVWEYNIAIAEEAAKNGFDEIQFDYVRFPDRKGLKFSIQNTEENRINAITGFLQEARKRLVPYNVFVSADIFGYVAWNLDDTQIGQKIDRLGSAVDYISLMLYPSGFQFGIPGYRNPVANSNRIVYLSLQRAQERSQLPTVRFRPWLQAFRDYAFDRRFYTATEIREQIKASDDFGSNGWMLWNPRNVYSADGLIKKKGIRTAQENQIRLTQGAEKAQIN